jgi:hypothetical protein
MNYGYKQEVIGSPLVPDRYSGYKVPVSDYFSHNFWHCRNSSYWQTGFYRPGSHLFYSGNPCCDRIIFSLQEGQEVSRYAHHPAGKQEIFPDTLCSALYTLPARSVFPVLPALVLFSSYHGTFLRDFSPDL